MSVKQKILGYRPGIRMIISIACVLGIIGSSGFSVYYAMKSLYDSTLRDAATMLFLDLETRSQAISSGLGDFVNAAKKRGVLAEFTVKNKTEIQWREGDFAGAKTFEDLGLDYLVLLPHQAEVTNAFSSYNGTSFYAQMTRNSATDQVLSLYEITNQDLKRAFTLDTKYAFIYILNRAGKLFYSNTAEINEETATKRQLVSSFIKMPFRQGQAEVQIDGGPSYGFFQEIPTSNMVIFAEKTKARAMEQVYATIRKVAAASGFYLLAAIILLQLPLWKTMRPIRSLTEMASKLSRGDFEITMQDAGFGELAILSRTFVNMADSLKNRDKTIAALHLDKIEKTKMEQGIKVASTIQDRFLFKPDQNIQSKISVAAKYVPSMHLAGDWYGVFYDAPRKETIISIVDITGHGIESAMMTPVMSVLFQEQKSRSSAQSFDIRAFLESCNTALYQYGNGVSTATGIIAKFSEETGLMTYLSAGHPAPVIVSQDGVMVKSKGSQGSGNILGFSPQIEMLEQSVSLSPGTIFALFSDGLMTAPVGGALGFSRKDLFNSLKNGKRTDSTQILGEILNTWDKKNVGVTVEDDMCIVIGLVK
jgi:serine phosphatase RsbU (regulator of sigma subunit)